jgi:8-oxo-dGTP pyrophosphatase MutT (NUDIX family)
MYITEDALRQIERKYGLPEHITLEYQMRPDEFDRLRHSQKSGRNHDVTFFILIAGKVVAISKPDYPPGVYRAPSGGIAPGEDFELGALREAREETGLDVQLDKYLLRASVRFSCGSAEVNWTTHVFTARPRDTIDQSDLKLEPIDRVEIKEARLVTIEELCGPIRQALISSGSTGLRYRAELTDLVIARLQRLMV